MFWLKLRLNRMKQDARPTREFSDALLLKIVGAPQPRPVFRFATVGVASLMLIFGMGTGVYAYESPDVIEGHPLFFVKQKLEKFEEQMTPEGEARAEFHAKMYSRRMNEAERLAEQSDKISTVLESAAVELDASIEELNVVPSSLPKQEIIIKKLEKENDRYERIHPRVRVDDEAKHRPPSPETMHKRLQPFRQNTLTP